MPCLGNFDDICKILSSQSSLFYKYFFFKSGPCPLNGNALLLINYCQEIILERKNLFTDNGRVRHYCVHNVTKGNSTVEIELLLDSKFETRDCQRCTCSRMGLSCCGYVHVHVLI